MHHLLLIHWITPDAADAASADALEPALLTLYQQFPDVEMTLLTPAGVVPAIAPVRYLMVATLDRELIDTLQYYAFDAAICFTPPGTSPYAIAYLCYLAGIPVRVGYSQEFGGGVLSSPIRPPTEPLPLSQYYLHLLQAIGLTLTVPCPFSEIHSGTY